MISRFTRKKNELLIPFSARVVFCVLFVLYSSTAYANSSLVKATVDESTGMLTWTYNDRFKIEFVYAYYLQSNAYDVNGVVKILQSSASIYPFLNVDIPKRKMHISENEGLKFISDYYSNFDLRYFGGLNYFRGLAVEGDPYLAFGDFRFRSGTDSMRALQAGKTLSIGLNSISRGSISFDIDLSDLPMARLLYEDWLESTVTEGQYRAALHIIFGNLFNIIIIILLYFIIRRPLLKMWLFFVSLANRLKAIISKLTKREKVHNIRIVDGDSLADQLMRLKSMHEDGYLDDFEYQKAKAKLLDISE